MLQGFLLLPVLVALAVTVAVTAGPLFAQATPPATRRDVGSTEARDVRVYRLRFVDAQSVGGLISRTFHDVTVAVDKRLNALSVLGTPARQRRIGAAIAQLDVADASVRGRADGGQANDAPAGATDSVPAFAMVVLKAVLPGPGGAQSTSAAEIAATVTDALSQSAPDLHVTVPTSVPSKLILTGSPHSIELAKALIAELDIAQPLVVLDTQILEVDEVIARNVGLQLTQPVVSTTIAENSAPLGPDGTPTSLGFQRFGRTPLSLGVQLNLLVQNGNARILSNPRITTISGQAATIRAGDSIAILTTAGGGVGTVATTQLQTFQTGVTLDITPVVNGDNFVSVTLHPTVNSLSGILNGIPQISTRETQTTVTLKEEQTLIIGGLIEDNTNRTETKIPLFGDLPLIGRLFRNSTLNKSRNELVVTVTPHIIVPGSAVPPAPRAIATPAPLPTLPPATPFPPQSGSDSQSVPRPASLGSGAPRIRLAPRVPNAPERPLQIPGSRARAAAGAPTPAAFATTNTFSFGKAPVSNYAAPGDPVTIFYATLSPTAIRNGQPITIAAITSTNVTKLALGYGSFSTQLGESTPGQWQSTFNFNASSINLGANRVSLMLTAARQDGAASSLAIPVSIVP